MWPGIRQHEAWVDFSFIPYLYFVEKAIPKPYFTDHALARFVAAQGQVVEKIVCHLWMNNLNKDAPVEIIDNVELHFKGGKKLTIGCNEDGEGLDAIEFNYQQSVAGIKEEFGDKIRLLAIDASPTKMWQDVIGLELHHVRITKEEDHYLSDAVVLDFGSEKREISAAPLDGVIIDYYEE